MGCPCLKPKNILDENLNEILDDCRITYLSPEQYFKIIEIAVKSKKDLNEKFNFQTEILDLTLKSTNLYLQLTYLKSVLINLEERGIKCYIIFCLLFLCKFENLQKLNKYYKEIFNLLIQRFEDLQILTENLNDIFLIRKIVEFYSLFLSKYLLDTYYFSLNDPRNDQKQMVEEYSYIYSDEVIKIFVDNLFSSYNERDFKIDLFLEANFKELNPYLLREKLYNIYLKNESFIKRKKMNSFSDNNKRFTFNENEPNDTKGIHIINKIEMESDNYASLTSNDIINNKKKIINNIPETNHKNGIDKFKEKSKEKEKENKSICEEINNKSNNIRTEEYLFSPSSTSKKENNNLIASTDSKNIETSNSKKYDEKNLFNILRQSPNSDLKITPEKMDTKNGDRFTLNNDSTKKKIEFNENESIEENEIQLHVNSSNQSNNLSKNENEEYNQNEELLYQLTNKSVEFFSLENFRDEALKYHNFKRILHDAKVLNPSEELENRAQEWAEYLAEKETFEKRRLSINNELVGENLCCFSDIATGENITEEWYNEIEKYNFESPKKKKSTINFTQMIWKSTAFVGFGCKKSESGNYFVVAFYFPSGNIEGLYQDMIAPLNQKILDEINNMDSEDEN